AAGDPGASGSSGADGSGGGGAASAQDRIRAATTEEVFDFIDRELGRATT
ncbi:MAG: hypothetical protein HOW97_41205, partial [Catenulispora sp.]|nr:hypothetical protein [Catenulispora sp.]